jgi:hypothetical protein
MRLTKKNMILITMFEMSKASKKTLIYEDILIKTFKKFPEVFHLTGYKQYPDTVILMRELYNLVPEGLIRIKKRKCVFTDLGLSTAEELKKGIKKYSTVSKSQDEINSLKKKIIALSSLQGFKLFKEGKIDRILDVDFYEFFNTSVRTNKIEVLSNIKQLTELIKKYTKYDEQLSNELKAYCELLIKSFGNLFK